MIRKAYDYFKVYSGDNVIFWLKFEDGLIFPQSEDMGRYGLLTYEELQELTDWIGSRDSIRSIKSAITV